MLVKNQWFYYFLRRGHCQTLSCGSLTGCPGERGGAAANTLIHFVVREGWGGAAANTLQCFVVREGEGAAPNTLMHVVVRQGGGLGRSFFPWEI